MEGEGVEGERLEGEGGSSEVSSGAEREGVRVTSSTELSVEVVAVSSIVERDLAARGSVGVRR